ncbi:hypothetical protein [Rossellomorea sp. NRS-1567]|uniref:hypothetical protein n=1 Tax=Rossellomorea sp. NRS-1567 TaxID=3233901 RepID=UPI003D26DB4D
MGLRVENKDFEYEPMVDNHPKKQMSMYSFLRLLGIFIFAGWGFMFFTVPLDLNHTFEWVHVKGIHVYRKMIGEFFLCLITVGFIYFGLLYLYFKKMWGRTFLLITLLSLGVINGILFFLSLN